MDDILKKVLQETASAIRQLSMEAVQKANSGHPGLPMGCAELGAYLYGHALRHNPQDPLWFNRDRMLLSAGHGSMWLYACLHLSGFDLSLNEIKRFRQLHSQTPGHPEYDKKRGIESTTGPLGQGVGNAVGQALGLKILEAKYNKLDHTIVDAKVYCLAGDGCLMEGVSSEVSSLAGHLCLNNLVIIHDENNITLDGPLEQSSSENVGNRYRSYGFDTYVMDGNCLESIDQVMAHIRTCQDRPIFISCKTIIGKGSKNKQGTHQAHGAPLGIDEVRATKQALGLPEEEFYIPASVVSFFKNRVLKQREWQREWQVRFEKWSKNYPKCAEDFRACSAQQIPADLEEKLRRIDIPSPISGRKASQAVIETLGEQLPFLYGGSADLSGSDCTMMKQFPLISSKNFEGRNIKYGIREFGMSTIASGLFQTDMFLPYVGTFLTFSDYMRNGVRLACLSGYHVIYQMTHDSIFIGEDGPTHQPVEHLAALRAMPNLHVLRPADANEVKGAWIAMLQYKSPSVIVLSRQNLPVLQETAVPFKEGVGRGGYLLKQAEDRPDFTLFATGSEVALAVEVAKALETKRKHVQVISMPCFEIFEKQEEKYKRDLIGGDLGQRVSIEAGVSQGWHRYIGRDGTAISIESFGLSAPMKDLAHQFRFTVDAVLSQIFTLDEREIPSV